MKTKVDYKTLPDMSTSKTVTTVKTLSNEFNMKPLKVAQILSAANVEPVGKIPVTVDGKPSVGKPTLAFDMKAANKAMTSAVVTKEAA